jgi:hypothetical protein
MESTCYEKPMEFTSPTSVKGQITNAKKRALGFADLTLLNSRSVLRLAA